MPEVAIPEMASQEGFEVVLPSGAVTKVLTESEVAFITERSEKYLTHNHFVNVSDVADVDKLMVFELLSWRYGNFLNRGGMDYFNKAVDEPELRRSLTSISSEMRQLKKILGIDKHARDAERGENSVAGYIAKLKERAREFGIHRDNQVAKVLELGMQLIALSTYHLNTTDEERRELGITLEDLHQWIEGVFKPELMALDTHARANQRMWIQEM